MVMKNVKKKIQRIPYLFLLMLFSCLTASAQQGITVKGTVVDDNGETIIGASVVVKGNNSIGTISDIDGNFVLTVPNEKSVLVVSFVGMEAQEVKATKGIIRVILKDDTQLLDEELSKAGYEMKQREGYGSGNWVLMDFGEIIVHVFDKENRLFYDLERIWRDGKHVDFSEL